MDNIPWRKHLEKTKIIQMEKTKEKLERDKRAFFGCYTHLEILQDSNNFWNEFKKLRSIESVTEEEISTIIKNFKVNDNLPHEPQRIKEGLYFELRKFPCETIDYLRSIGILIPFRDYSVEEIIKLGWARIEQ